MVMLEVVSVISKIANHKLNDILTWIRVNAKELMDYLDFMYFGKGNVSQMLLHFKSNIKVQQD